MAGTRPPPAKPPAYSIGRPWPELNEGISYSDVIKRSDSGRALIEFYSANYKSSAPLEGWLHRIKNGQITVNGEVVSDPDFVLRDESKVVYQRLPWKEPSAPYILHILYEDSDMVAINKPSGLQVLSGGLFQQRTVLTQLKWKNWENSNSDINSNSISNHKRSCNSHPVPVHRLGRGTSGLLLCAKTKTAKVRLASYFAEGTANSIIESDESERQISKFYRALASGIIKDDEVIIKQPIGSVKYEGVAKGLYVASSTGKPAMSKVCILERDFQKDQTLVQVEIHSGRPHQIRIHLAYIGHPLLGDPLYCNGGIPKIYESDSSNISFANDGGYEKPVNPMPGDCGYHLHAHWLVLSHPISNEKIIITAPLPAILRTKSEREEQS